MKERPILFSAPMVRAILAGTKTQTRRIVKLPNEPTFRGGWGPATIGGPGVYDSAGNPAPEHVAIGNDTTGKLIACPYGSPGDRLWVREAHYCDNTTAPNWNPGKKVEATPELISEWRESLYYRADATQTGTCCEVIPECACAEYKTASGKKRSPWRPGIHMPRWASRIDLEVSGVRVERVQAISMSDAIAEGAQRFDDIPPSKMFPDSPHQNRWSMESPKDCGQCLGSPQSAFGNLWIKINGQESWNANPWVWVVEFRRIEAAARAA